MRDSILFSLASEIPDEILKLQTVWKQGGIIVHVIRLSQRYVNIPSALQTKPVRDLNGIPVS